MGLRAPSVASIATAVLFALSVFGFTLFVWKSFGGPIPLEPQGYRFTVPFDANASQLTANADVRISGVSVGKVKSVTPRAGRLAAVLEIEERFAPIPSDVRAVTRAKTLLGETFVELSPGSRDAPSLPEGGMLPVAQVAETQGLDEVLSAFDEQTREDFSLFLNGFAEAIDGRSASVNAALGNAEPASEQLETLVALLDEQRSEVRALTQDASTALGAIGRRDGELRAMVVAGNDVLSATAERDVQLMGTVRALPPFLRDLRATLRSLDETTTVAGPVLRDLRPSAPLLRPAIQEAETLVPQFVPVASELDPVIDAALEGAPRLTEVLRAAAPLVDVLEPATRQLVPVATVLDAQKDLLVNGLALTGAATQARTDDQNYLRVILPLGNESLAGYARRTGSNRYNPYIEPGGLAKVGEGLEAFDCRNAGNPTPVPVIGSGTPPCREQGPFAFGPAQTRFPRVEQGP